MRCVRSERRRHGAPALGIGRAQRGDTVGIGIEIFFDAKPGAIWKRRGEASFGADEVKAVRNEPILVGGKKRRAGEHAQIYCVEVVTKAGQRDFAGLDRAAGDVGRLDDGDLPAFGGQMQRRRQAVDAGADHHRIVRHSPAPDLRLPDRLPAQIFHI